MKRKKWLCMLSICLMLVFFGSNVMASESDLDLVIIMDKSGSMATADKDRIVIEAVKVLLNMMPAMQSRVGLIAFNNEPELLTINADNEGELVSLEKFQDALAVKALADGIEYYGDTGIGNALRQGTDLLEAKGREGAKKASLLFTDGVDDFDDYTRQPELEAEKNNQNYNEALVWARENQCRIYSVGFNYPTEDGTMSMGENGEGLIRLQKLADNTQGSVKEQGSITEIEASFADMLAQICDIRYIDDIDPIPGDGGMHERTININPSVLEADIRIHCDTLNAVAQGKIHLFRPGEEVECDLTNSDDKLRYDVDATAASIKILLPEKGEWRLQVEGITGDDIQVGLLEHNGLVWETALEVPEGNAQNTAFQGDNVKVKVFLKNADKTVAIPELCRTVSGSIAAVPRTNPEKKEEAALTYVEEEGCFEAEFPVEEESVYDISVSAGSDRFFYEDTLILESGNRPLELVKEMPAQEVKVHNTLEIQDIFSYVSDLEGDAITAEAVSDDEKLVKAFVNNDTGVLSLEGVKWGSSNVTVSFTDAQNNTVFLYFCVKVKDFWKVAILSAIPFLIVLIGLLVIITGIRKFRIIKGFFTVKTVIVRERKDSEPIQVYREYKGKIRAMTQRRKKNMEGVLLAYSSFADRELPPRQKEILQPLIKKLCPTAREIKIIGSVGGRNGVMLRTKRNLPVAINNHKEGQAIKWRLKDKNECRVKFFFENGTVVEFVLKYTKG